VTSSREGKSAYRAETARPWGTEETVRGTSESENSKQRETILGLKKVWLVSQDDIRRFQDE